MWFGSPDTILILASPIGWTQPRHRTSAGGMDPVGSLKWNDHRWSKRIFVDLARLLNENNWMWDINFCTHWHCVLKDFLTMVWGNRISFESLSCHEVFLVILLVFHPLWWNSNFFQRIRHPCSQQSHQSSTWKHGDVLGPAATAS